MQQRTLWVEENFAGAFAISEKLVAYQRNILALNKSELALERKELANLIHLKG